MHHRRVYPVSSDVPTHEAEEDVEVGRKLAFWRDMYNTHPRGKRDVNSQEEDLFFSHKQQRLFHIVSLLLVAGMLGMLLLVSVGNGQNPSSSLRIVCPFE